MNTTIYYHPEAYTTSGPKLMGRNAAGESFLKGFIQHSSSTEFWVQVQQKAHGQHFADSLQQLGRKEIVKVVDKNSLSSLKQVGMVYYPGPGLVEHAFHRSGFGHTSWSLCGITHTTSSAAAMDAITGLITGPVQTWDSLICTSSAVKDNVQRLLQVQVNYLQERLGMTKFVLPLMPVIPLGIHTKDFEFSNEQKQSARTALGADTKTLVVMFMGRLSFHAKAHPLAMYQALEIAAQKTSLSGKKVILVECGWHANEFIQNAYKEAAQLACPSVKVITLDGRVAENRITAWAGADIFCSLSDNIQETFGIVPIEAMAAGLPVVVSDWDGYKDTVRHEIDGYRIPTSMPKPGMANDLALRHALQVDTYDMYCGFTSSLIAVDIEAAARSLVQLFESSKLRAQMGQAGRKRAAEVYDWKVVIAQYESLWTQQHELRLQAQLDIESKKQTIGNVWPARVDPFFSFESYPSNVILESTLLCLVDDSKELAIQRAKQYINLAMISYAKLVLPDLKEIELVLNQTPGNKKAPKPAQDWVKEIPADRKALVLRGLSWLIKMGILKIAS
jgi:glycosyltransferase involved in cell wall biosynthesis